MEAIKLSKKSLTVRIVKAGVKALIVYIAYFIFTLITQPIYESIGHYAQVINIFFIVMVCFAFLIEFFSKTIFKYMLEFARGLFIIFYFITALNGGIIKMNVEGINVIADLRFFLLMLTLIMVVGIARTVLSAVDFLHEKSEEEAT
ncbi:hypothetical protein DRO54_02250 [Candidatus Bathyarchaeota archaeon]|nr:MAG: hypothetical protein DRO54_02250 [Candidatus Bathyarchaeota archaeon]